MANPVTEQLTDWLNDAPTGDTNLPNSSSNAAIGSSQDLSGNLRLLKSVIRDEGINKSWERWKGLKNLANSANIAFTYVSATQFSVNDSFIDPARTVAVIGRRVKATLSGSTIYGTIVATAFTTVTTITVTWDSGALDATLSEVQFGPELRSLDQEQPQLLTNRTGVTLGVGDVVAPSASNDSSVIDAQSDQSLQYLVTLGSVPNAAVGAFKSAGIVLLNVNGAVTRGHYLKKHAASGTYKAADSGTAAGSGTKAPDGSFAIALDSIGSTGQIKALLLGATVTPIGNHAATHLNTGSDPIIGLTQAVVYQIKESAGLGTDLTIQAIADGQILIRSGATITSTGQIGIGNLKIASGSTSLSGVSDADVAFNRCTFLPSETASGADRTEHPAFYDSGDPGDFIGRKHYTINPALTHVIRWEYLTASDNPVIWAAYDDKSGAIRAVWASDDPTPNDVPGLIIPGCTVKKFVAADLNGLDFTEDELNKADAVISGNKLRSEHRLYRALQQKGELPSSWLLGNASIAKDGRLQMGKVHGPNLPQAQSQRKTDKDILDDRVQKIMANNALPQALRDAFAQISKLID